VTTPPPLPRRFESPFFFVAVLVGGCALALGILSIYAAAFPGGSGEWASLTQLIALVLEIPLALLVLGLALTQRRRSYRLILISLGTLIILAPVVAEITGRVRTAMYRHELERKRAATPSTASQLSYHAHF
jgi:hypothetical protein